MTNQTIASIIRTDYPELAPEMPIRRAAALLVEFGSSSAPVIAEDGRLAGILSQKDCFRSALNASYYREWKGNVAEHMATDVVAVNESDEIFEIAEKFLILAYRAFPVVDGAMVRGMLHRSEVLRLLLELG